MIWEVLGLAGILSIGTMLLFARTSAWRAERASMSSPYGAAARIFKEGLDGFKESFARLGPVESADASGFATVLDAGPAGLRLTLVRRIPEGGCSRVERLAEVWESGGRVASASCAKADTLRSSAKEDLGRIFAAGARRLLAEADSVRTDLEASVPSFVGGEAIPAVASALAGFADVCERAAASERAGAAKSELWEMAVQARRSAASVAKGVFAPEKAAAAALADHVLPRLGAALREWTDLSGQTGLSSGEERAFALAEREIRSMPELLLGHLAALRGDAILNLPEEMSIVSEVSRAVDARGASRL